MLDIQSVFHWSPWSPLLGSWRAGQVPDAPGLYRIRRIERSDLDYIGQTGMGTMTLRARLGMLRGVYGDVMPYRDPHTAGPALWALRQTPGTEFEVSVLPVEGTTPWRKGLESLAIALYRQEHGASPNVEFGRMPAGYRQSSANNARLVMMGKRFRGGLAPDLIDDDPSVPPAGPLVGTFIADGWGGHTWSPWTPLSEAARLVPRTATGLYRIRGQSNDQLVYIGQGLIAMRVAQHARRAVLAADVQGVVFRDAGRLEASWVVSQEWSPRGLLELENDLIGAHVLRLGAVPIGQFLG
jgi:hypothetical protein